MTTLGQAIKANRLAVKMTASHLAKKMGIHRNTLANWEKDKTSPTALDLIAIADNVGCTVDDLLTGKQPIPIRTSLDFCCGA